MKPRKLKPGERPQVLLALEWYVHEINLGVAQYAHEHNWILHDSLGHTMHRMPETLRFDGIITLLSYPDHFITREIVAKAKVPVVDLNADLPEFKLPRVLPDNETIGRLAAEHLISRGFRHLAYYQTSDAEVERERRDGFCKAVQAAGREFILLSAVEAYRDSLTQNNRLAWMGRELVKLPRPLGLMSQFDQTANELCIACRRAGLRVPEDMAIVGVDNDPIAAELGEVPLTSVDSNHRGQGYQGAALLDRLMRGEKPPAAPIRVPPKGLVVRHSTDILMMENPAVAAALRHINGHFRENLTAGDIARAAGVSRRSLYRVFQENVGRSITEEIERLRVACSQQMLTCTDLKVSDIAREAGFASPGRMTAALSKHFGKRPSEFR
jgi:LacI family transcriptional regulator